MKKNKMFCFVCGILIILFAMSPPCYANSAENKSMVYASGEQLDELYELLQKDSYDFHKALEVDSLIVVKESITPIYTIDLLDYARTGKLKIVPLWKSHTGLSGNGKGNAYIAKTLTADGKYGGNIMFYVENGVAYNMLYTPSEYSPSWPDGVEGYYSASASYADHAIRIANALNEKDLISAYDVKYVVIDMVGEFFYVNNSKYSTLVSIGQIPTDKSNQSSVIVDYHMGIGDELLTLAKKQLTQYEAFLKEKAEWEAANPGKTWDRGGGYSVSPIMSGCSQVENIVDIAAYLDIDYSLPSNPDFSGGIVNNNEVTNENDNSISNENDAFLNSKMILITTSIVTIALLTVAITVWINKRNKQRLKP